MSPEMAKNSPVNNTGDLNFKDTELTLSLPGGSCNPKSGTKRGFSETADLNLVIDETQEENFKKHMSGKVSSEETKPSKEKAQMVGWPPVRSFRKNIMKNSKYVKVAVDGAPYLRKVDLELYNSYQQLLNALNEMFSCFTIRNFLNDGKLVDSVNGSEYVPTYEDKDGDWMLVGDVPWNMFLESCKRLRLMKSSEAYGLAPRTPPRNSSTGSSTG